MKIKHKDHYVLYCQQTTYIYNIFFCEMKAAKKYAEKVSFIKLKAYQDYSMKMINSILLRLLTWSLMMLHIT